MDILATENRSLPSLVYPAQSTFLYTSTYRSLLTSGVFERINTPINDKVKGSIPLIDNVRDAISRARRAGQKSPIIVGAIPFDTTQPSSLYIPESHEFVERSRITGRARSGLNCRPGVIGITPVPDEAQFKHAVAQAVDYFRRGTIKKAVLSRTLEIHLAETIDAANIMNNLIVQNPSGYHFSLPLVDSSLLMGASPELLIRKQGTTVHANPLAGSSRRVTDPHLDRLIGERLLHSAKDNHEHQLVTAEIQRLLHPLCTHLRIPVTPALMNTTTMWHLSTQITAELAASELSVLQLAALLHPTPAVCGSPTAEAYRLIARLEPYDRGLFSGLVGWCDASGDGEWVIAIRCGSLLQNRVRLFAGAGIVEGSTPEAEWAETAAKLGTMLAAFGLNPGADAP